MDRLDQLKAIAKRQGITNVAKVILENDDIAKGISEHEFVAMLTEAAREYQKSGESPTQAFAHMFAAPTAEGLMLRQAHAAVKIANRVPPVVTESSVSKTRDSSGTFDKLLRRDNEGSAYDQLVEKAERWRKFDPDLSFDQAFSKVFTDPANVELAQQERRENRPVSTTYPKNGERQ
jgi:hypothetical protein